MKLTELAPEWLGFYGGPPQCGVSFRCPGKAACEERIHVMFDTSIHGHPAPPPNGHDTPLWKRDGMTFDTLSLSPSIDASRDWHWHGFIRNGEVIGA